VQDLELGTNTDPNWEQGYFEQLGLKTNALIEC
jgi:hypothetical protein